MQVRLGVPVGVVLLLSLACSSGGSGGDDGDPPSCAPSATRPCYAGPPGTLGVGACHAGIETCAADGSAWGACRGARTPVAEVCGNFVDEDCNGSEDDAPDLDGDGWTRCGGDCCDAATDGCDVPELVNPGAYDRDGNGVDDDCSGGADDAGTACSTAAKLANVTGADLAAALDLCQVTTPSPAPADRRWGLVSAALQLSNGTGSPAAEQVAVLGDLGVVTPRRNATFAALSSGTARDALDPGFTSPFAPSFTTANSASAPQDYLEVHGGTLPAVPGCPRGAATVHDPVQLRLVVRVPTNAAGLRVRFRMFSSEYPQYVCSEFNDRFLVLLDSANRVTSDKNIAYDAEGNAPSVDVGWFDHCEPAAPPLAGFACASGTGGLQGTGYLDVAATPDGGAATSWLAAEAPVVPGETITLRFVTWDTGDHHGDSLVLLDGFEWLFDATSVGTRPD